MKLSPFRVSYEYDGGKACSVTMASSLVKAWQIFQTDNPQTRVVRVESEAGEAISIPSDRAERRVVVACYHGRHAEYRSHYPLWMYSLAWVARNCWSLAQERGYLRGMLSFKIVTL